jgi:hypothetical protein
MEDTVEKANPENSGRQSIGNTGFEDICPSWAQRREMAHSFNDDSFSTVF